jgi:hypothetical protein
VNRLYIPIVFASDTEYITTLIQEGIFVILEILKRSTIFIRNIKYRYLNNYNLKYFRSDFYVMK